MKIFFTAILSFLLLMTTTEAAKIDTYRDMLSSGRFTLKYTIAEPPIHVTNKEATLKGNSGFFGDFKMTDTTGFQLQHINNFQNIIVYDGANKYTEKLINSINENVSLQAVIAYTLKKNGETFRFCSIQKDGKKTYWSSYSNHEIQADLEEKTNIMSALDVMNEDYSYDMLTTALSPIISRDKIIATPFTPEYKFIGSGKLDGGLSYEDFFGSKNGFNCAIRYYFSGDTLTKIAVFDYVMNNSQIQTYEKYLVQIDEFSATTDQSYFTLPAQLKDKTRRDKEAKK